jgi:hypothetical protein
VSEAGSVAVMKCLDGGTKLVAVVVIVVVSGLSLGGSDGVPIKAVVESGAVGSDVLTYTRES